MPSSKPKGINSLAVHTPVSCTVPFVDFYISSWYKSESKKRPCLIRSPQGTGLQLRQSELLESTTEVTTRLNRIRASRGEETRNDTEVARNCWASFRRTVVFKTVGQQTAPDESGVLPQRAPVLHLSTKD